MFLFILNLWASGTELHNQLQVTTNHWTGANLYSDWLGSSIPEMADNLTSGCLILTIQSHPMSPNIIIGLMNVLRCSIIS